MLGGASAAEESGGAGGEVGGAASSSIYPSGGVAGEVDESIRMEETERGGGGGGGGIRWPRQETLALLKIRSDMDAVFRDSSLKGPLWDEVSRKMGELGYQRSAKKCKEKFENLYKYHKRTKDARASKPEGKSYRFFDQLAALETTPPPPAAAFNHPPPRGTPQETAEGRPIPPNATTPPPHVISTTVPSNHSSKMPQNNTTHSSVYHQLQVPQIQRFDLPTSSLNSDSTSSSSTSSEEGVAKRQGRKRKWEDFFGGLMADVIQKQQELQKQFLEALERREIDRAAREEARRNQEMARISREHQLLVQERSIAAAKDAAVIAFLQKMTEQNLQIPLSNSIEVQQLLQTTAPPPPPPPPPAAAVRPPVPRALTVAAAKMVDPLTIFDASGDDKDTSTNLPASSSRWPKAETETLIQLRTDLDLKYQDSGAKGPLWEEVSAAMAKYGYNRSSKRCKEKWENINKYFKKVKESNKKRPEDSKTCPYFQQLDAVYKERAKSGKTVIPIMAMPEQQWPLPEKLHDQDNDNNSENIEEYHGDDEYDQGPGSDEMITNKKPSNTE